MAGNERDVQILSKAFEKEKRCQTKEEEPRTGVWGGAVSIRGCQHRVTTTVWKLLRCLLSIIIIVLFKFENDVKKQKIKEPDYYR